MPVDVFISHPGNLQPPNPTMVGKLYAEVLVLDLELLKSSAPLYIGHPAETPRPAFELQCILGPQEPTGGFYLDPTPTNSLTAGPLGRASKEIRALKIL